jgi:phosphate transport system permease protein
MSVISAEQRDSQPVDLPNLEKSLKHVRTLNSAVMSAVIGGMSVLAMVPLASVLWMLLKEGSARIGVALFTELPPAAGMPGGGVGNALLGTLVVVAIAALISVPFGILAAVYLAEYGPDSKTASAVRFCAKVLTGLPSILAGVFAYGLVVLTTGTFSAPAGGVALALLMIPTVLLTAEDAIHMVPARMREAAIGMGCTRTQMVLRVTLPTALPGILTGVMLAVARAAGETAPLLFTTLFSDYWLTANVMEPTPTLAVLIFDFSGSPYPNQIQIAWGASLVLVFLVLLLNVGAQWVTRRYFPR